MVVWVATYSQSVTAETNLHNRNTLITLYDERGNVDYVSQYYSSQLYEQLTEQDDLAVTL
jgi:hypothetical protein